MAPGRQGSSWLLAQCHEVGVPKDGSATTELSLTKSISYANIFKARVVCNP